MARISGLARSTIYRGLSNIRHHILAPAGRSRREGGGRKKKVIEDPTLVVVNRGLAGARTGAVANRGDWSGRGAVRERHRHRSGRPLCRGGTDWSLAIPTLLHASLLARLVRA
jgi:hypothetical protein